jgi:hypothetical protein
MPKYVDYLPVSGKDYRGRDIITVGHFVRVMRQTPNSVWRCAVTNKSYGKRGVAPMREIVRTMEKA